MSEDPKERPRLSHSPNEVELNERATRRAPIHLEPCELQEWLDSRSEWILYLDPDMSKEDLRQLYEMHVRSACPNDSVLDEIAAHENTPADILYALSEPQWQCTHLGLTTNPNLPPDILRRLAKSRKWAVREHIAWHRSTPIDALQRLAKSRYAFIGEAARQNLLGIQATTGNQSSAEAFLERMIGGDETAQLAGLAFLQRPGCLEVFLKLVGVSRLRNALLTGKAHVKPNSISSVSAQFDRLLRDLDASAAGQ